MMVQPSASIFKILWRIRSAGWADYLSYAQLSWRYDWKEFRYTLSIYPSRRIGFYTLIYIYDKNISLTKEKAPRDRDMKIG